MFVFLSIVCASLLSDVLNCLAALDSQLLPFIYFLKPGKFVLDYWYANVNVCELMSIDGRFYMLWNASIIILIIMGYSIS